MAKQPQSAQDPLLQPIHYRGQVYFTSHYFHQQYLLNRPEGAKYARQKDFMRLIRSIEAYPLYVERGDIVEIQSKADIGEETEAQDLRLAFKSNNYAALMLINATAQVALTHHLDDEISKQVSVEANAQAAQASLPPPPRPRTPISDANPRMVHESQKPPPRDTQWWYARIGAWLKSKDRPDPFTFDDVLDLLELDDPTPNERAFVGQLLSRHGWSSENQYVPGCHVRRPRQRAQKPEPEPAPAAAPATDRETLRPAKPEALPSPEGMLAPAIRDAVDRKAREATLKSYDLQKAWLERQARSLLREGHSEVYTQVWIDRVLTDRCDTVLIRAQDLRNILSNVRMIAMGMQFALDGIETLETLVGGRDGEGQP